jgi:hypothetical protein
MIKPKKTTTLHPIQHPNNMKKIYTFMQKLTKLVLRITSILERPCLEDIQDKIRQNGNSVK